MQATTRTLARRLEWRRAELVGRRPVRAQDATRRWRAIFGEAWLELPLAAKRQVESRAIAERTTRWGLFARLVRAELGSMGGQP
jgi:hypothetical protein